MVLDDKVVHGNTLQSEKTSADRDSKLKEHEDTSEQDNNSDSDFLYFDKENKTRLFDIIEGKDADKYDTISDLQNLEKSHCTIGYALDLTGKTS
ncbi:Hypothetical predicted protein [Mytilus galloprovincialis]|uniref:Uncharacterized protein n=1 Tax=Mytilus galloprovincialis TaxID=29158 RepID=A0A8B6DVV1_MYTGA|nr:Hypothetical predicted protein [Mytilus galloprovincialis]